MIDFPEEEMQTYRFTLRNTYYRVEAYNGNFEVYYSDASTMPNPGDISWVLLDDSDVLYWIGVVYAYKMTDDTTCNVYDCQDYRTMGAACHMLNQVPDFEDLERIIGYGQGVGGSEYADWSTRAKQWLERERRRGIPAFPNSLAEGAD
jgi:hypothetical protein